MSKLQEILNEKWPLTTGIHSTEDGAYRLRQRRIFSDGYNAGFNAALIDTGENDNITDTLNWSKNNNHEK